MARKLEGKTAVITGGTEGIGLATARRFVAEGAFVFITERRQKELDDAVQAIGTNVAGVQGDIARLADLDRLYETVAKVVNESILCSPMPALANWLPLGPSPRNTSTGYSTSM